MSYKKSSGTSISQDCMTGACESHRIDLINANTEYYAEVQILKQRLYISWLAFGIMGALLIYFRKVI